MGIKDKLRRLERQAEREAIVVPQWEGPPAKFPKSVLPEMFLHNMRRLGGEDVERLADGPDGFTAGARR